MGVVEGAEGRLCGAWGAEGGEGGTMGVAGGGAGGRAARRETNWVLVSDSKVLRKETSMRRCLTAEERLARRAVISS